MLNEFIECCLWSALQVLICLILNECCELGTIIIPFYSWGTWDTGSQGKQLKVKQLGWARNPELMCLTQVTYTASWQDQRPQQKSQCAPGCQVGEPFSRKEQRGRSQFFPTASGLGDWRKSGSGSRRHRFIAFLPLPGGAKLQPFKLSKSRLFCLWNGPEARRLEVWNQVGCSQLILCWAGTAGPQVTPLGPTLTSVAAVVEISGEPGPTTLATCPSSVYTVSSHVLTQGFL